MSNLIYDLGFHKGEDTENYLNKGFKVIAVEANTKLYEKGLRNFEDVIESGQLILINKAVYNTNSNLLSFYINPNISEWGSIRRDIAEQDGLESIEQQIETISYIYLCKKYGTPYYMKVDIESADTFVAQDLWYAPPKHVSFELNKIDYSEIFSLLKLNKYKQFQIINQLHNANSSSGEFAEYLEDDRWITFDEALSRYMKYRELKIIDNKNLALGWVDIHAKR